MEMHYTIVELDETMLTEHQSRVRESVTLKLSCSTYWKPPTVLLQYQNRFMY